MGQPIEVAMTLAQISATLFVAIVFSTGRSPLPPSRLRAVVTIAKIVGALASLYLTLSFARWFVQSMTVATPWVIFFGVLVFVGCFAIVFEWIWMVKKDLQMPRAKKRKKK